MKKILSILCFVPLFVFAQYYQPKPKNGELVRHTFYSLSYFEKHEQAEWVYYKLTPAMISGTAKRTNDFRSDPKVSTGSASLSDYKGSGFDRGHLAPAADMKLSFTAMSESFYLSNMSPQNPSFNRGGWKKLESLIRNWVMDKGELHVMTGPILTDKWGNIGINKVSVPSAFYKVVFSEKSKEMIGFIMPNAKIYYDLYNYVQTVDSIENSTGIDFFYQLDDKLEHALEASNGLKNWSFFYRNIKKYSKTKTYKSNTSTRCTATAKSTGNQCKNKTKDSSGYCYVHKPKPKRTEKSGYSGRCQATTKAGNQCKRKASAGSNYCWQH